MNLFQLHCNLRHQKKEELKFTGVAVAAAPPREGQEQIQESNETYSARTRKASASFYFSVSGDLKVLSMSKVHGTQFKVR
jgi:hypothetical protein